MDGMRELCKYVRKILGLICRFKEENLVSRPPTLFTAVSQPNQACYAQSLHSSLYAQLQNFEAFSNMQNQWKKDQMWSVLLPNIWLLWLLLSMPSISGFFDHIHGTLTDAVMWVCWQSICRNLWPNFVYISVQLYWNTGVVTRQAKSNMLRNRGSNSLQLNLKNLDRTRDRTFLVSRHGLACQQISLVLARTPPIHY